MLRRTVLLVTALALVVSAPAAMSGQSYRMAGISPSFDGWEERPDGTRLFYFGYINRNATPVDIPVGADNGFESGAADRGQPTHFLQGRHEHVFTVVAQKDMTGKLVWNVKSEMGVQKANASFDQLYMLEETENDSPDAKPPVITLVDLSARVGQPVQLRPDVRPAVNSGRREVEGAAAEAAGLNVSWSVYRGSGAVTFSSPAPAPRPGGEAARERRAPAAVPGVHTVACGSKPEAGCGAAVATFSQPGTYRLRVSARQDGLDGLTFATVTVTP